MSAGAAGRALAARRLGLLVAAALGLALVPLAAATAPELRLRPCTLRPSVEARCGTFTVPENRAVKGGRTIALRVAVIPARDGGTRRDPIVVLAGGPGGSAVESAFGMLQLFSSVNGARDILLVDQRGTGRSNALECPVPKKPLPATAAAIRAYVEACLGRFRADPARYTTVPAMEDLAEVIRALGYEKVNVYGGSYGATAAQYLLAQHPELVRTAIFDGGTLLDIPIFERWGPNGERALRSVLARCAATPRCVRAYPRVRREAFEMMAALRKRPVRALGVVIGPAEAAGTLQALTRSPEGAARIPWVAHRAVEGD
jgi:pimeloyl-ACP methyl ester carboxylesterase